MNIFYMARKRNRYACLSDLEGYFRKRDLLGGLSEEAKKELRINIGIGEFGQTAPLRISHEDLWTKVTKNGLSIGTSYIITDFQSIYTFNAKVNGVEVAGGLGVNGTPLSPVYELLVTALDKDRLSAKAYILGEDWEVEYDIEQVVLNDGTKTKGKITWLRDTKGNSAFYDFKSIKFRRFKDDFQKTTIDLSKNYIDLYTFSVIKDGSVATDSSETDDLIEYNELKLNSWDNVFLGFTAHNIFEPEFRRNMFIYGCRDSHFLWKTTDNLVNEEVRYLTGIMNNQTFKIGNTEIATSITKTIHKVNEATIVSFLDPITYTHQVIIL